MVTITDVERASLAEKHGIEVPANRFLYKKVYEIEAEY